MRQNKVQLTLFTTTCTQMWRYPGMKNKASAQYLLNFFLLGSLPFCMSPLCSWRSSSRRTTSCTCLRRKPTRPMWGRTTRTILSRSLTSTPWTWFKWQSPLAFLCPQVWICMWEAARPVQTKGAELPITATKGDHPRSEKNPSSTNLSLWETRTDSFLDKESLSHFNRIKAFLFPFYLIDKPAWSCGFLACAPSRDKCWHSPSHLQVLVLLQFVCCLTYLTIQF